MHLAQPLREIQLRKSNTLRYINVHTKNSRARVSTTFHRHAYFTVTQDARILVSSVPGEFARSTEWRHEAAQ